MPSPAPLLILFSLRWFSPVLAQGSEEPVDPTEDPPVEEPPPPPSEVYVVTGTRTATPISETVVSTEVITREEVTATGASDASELLESALGVQVTRTFRGAGVQMQGLDAEYVLVLVNGQRLLGRRDGVVDLSRIPAERIERVEIVKGASSSLYGSDAIGGVINIITREPEDPYELEATASYGSRHTVDSSLTAGVKRDLWTLGGTVGWQRTDGYDLDPSDAQTDGPAWDQISADLDGSRDLGASSKLLASGGYLLRDRARVDLYTGGAVFDVRNLTEEGRFRLGADVLAGQGRVQGGVTGSVFRDQMVEDQRLSDDLDDYEETVERLLQVDGQSSHLLGPHLLTWGLEGAAEQLVSARLTRDGARQRAAAFAQDEWKIGEAHPLRLVPGARADLDSWFGVHATPRLAVRLDPTPWLALRASGGTGFRAPNFKEMFLLYENPSANYRVEGNPDLLPERSLNLTAGFEGRGGPVVLRLDAYHNRLRDMIDFDFVSEADATTPALYEYQNIAEAKTAGLESALRYQPVPAFTLDLGYTYTWTRDLVTSLPLDGRAPHRGNVALTARHEGTGLSATARAEIVGTTWFYDVDDADGVTTLLPVDPYTNLHARLEKRLFRGSERRGDGHLRLFATVDNLLDAGDPQWVHLDPRTFTAGLTYRPLESP